MFDITALDTSELKSATDNKCICRACFQLLGKLVNAQQNVSDLSHSFHHRTSQQSFISSYSRDTTTKGEKRAPPATSTPTKQPIKKPRHSDSDYSSINAPSTPSCTFSTSSIVTTPINVTETHYETSSPETKASSVENRPRNHTEFPGRSSSTQDCPIRIQRGITYPVQEKRRSKKSY